MKFAINLLWVRQGQVGGTEVVVRNLLDGMLQRKEDFHAVLITSRDNAESFRHYTEEDSRFEMQVAPVESAGIMKRIVWQNFNLSRFLKKAQIRFCFSPVYDRPFFNGGVHYITTIHDIQAYHYPSYHPFHEVVYSKMIWHADKVKSDANIAISQYVLEDLVKVYHFNAGKMTTIYDPVILDKTKQAKFSEVAEKYKVEDRKYFYTVGQLIPHKNIPTLLKVMERVNRDECLSSQIPCRLLISGINGNAAEQIIAQIKDSGLEHVVQLTGYVSNEERNALYAHARAFLFPSVFEGFGIPPIEAMILGTPVITTKCTCIPEVTQNLAEYVEDPYNAEEWIRYMKEPVDRSDELDLQVYDQINIAGQYLDFIKKIWMEAEQ